ncbi:hypothetical protein [Clostridium beijerinckii]|uniref:hypothetical protein n=1 Tax=Clostridium beijerinckii TaxID=1520 RepID=UPI0015714D7D|nr:hypothetical protein [Clostridium beijerinckii]NRT72211.1 hypothetical protein [Clostridium beijerinckii]
MLDKIFGVFVYFFQFYAFNILCRFSAAYIPTTKYKKYIIIRNEIIANILIAKSIGRDRIVEYGDRNKMSIMGIISYIFISPVNILNLIINLVILFSYNGLGNLATLS